MLSNKISYISMWKSESVHPVSLLKHSNNIFGQSKPYWYRFSWKRPYYISLNFARAKNLSIRYLRFSDVVKETFLAHLQLPRQRILVMHSTFSTKRACFKLCIRTTFQHWKWKLRWTIIAKRAKSKNRMQITEFPARLSRHKLVLREIQGI